MMNEYRKYIYYIFGYILYSAERSGNKKRQSNRLILYKAKPSLCFYVSV